MITQRYTVQYRRKRSGKTDYKKRLSLLSGKKLRLVIRRSNKHILLQAVIFENKGDKVVLSAHTQELEKQGWKGNTGNSSAAYLCGLLFSKKAKAKKITELIPDIGMQTSVKGSLIYAALKGINDGGLKVPCAQEVYPEEKRIKGEHIAQHAKVLKGNVTAYQKYFARYLKVGLAPEELPKHFEQIKKSLMV